jgi:hypothetical protein
MSQRKRGLSVLGLAVVAALAMAVVASAASASQWYVNNTLLTGSKTIKCEKKSGTTLTMEGKIQKTAVVLTASGVECVTGDTIQNTSGEGTATGKLKFTGITVSGLKAGCTAENFETNALVAKVKTFSTLGTKTGVEFAPASGVAFGNLKLLSTCGGAAGNYPVEGTEVGESSALGVNAKRQLLKFNTASNEVSTLKLGSEPAKLFGEVENFLSPEEEYKSE